MTRFHTEYELKKQDMKLTEELFENPEKFKEELKVAINEENHRSNVDRAKKKSVSQYFDYDKFHQMVLGADLKGMKMDDVIKIEPEKAILNPISEIKNKSNPQDIFSGNFVPTVQKNTMNKTLDDSMTLNKFKIEFKKFDTPANKINYLYDNFNKELFFELFNVDIIDADLFTGLIFNIGLYLKEAKEQVKNDKNEFLFYCIDILEKAKYFQKYKMFIGKKHKAPYTDILSNEAFVNSIPNAKEVINKIIK
jgi:hypothetical protein